MGKSKMVVIDGVRYREEETDLAKRRAGAGSPTPSVEQLVAAEVEKATADLDARIAAEVEKAVAALAPAFGGDTAEGANGDGAQPAASDDKPEQAAVEPANKSRKPATK